MLNNYSKENSLLEEPERRNIFPILFMVLFIVVTFFCFHNINFINARLETFYVLIITTTALIILEFLKRVLYFLDGLVKNNADRKEIVKAAFSFNTISIITIVLCIGCFLAMIISLYQGLASFSFLELEKSEFLISKQKITLPVIAFFSALCFSYLLVDLIKLNECRAQKLEAFYDLNGLDYGSSMASSYFFGYLKIILPSDGRENEGIAGRIKHFEDDNNVSVPVKKLFVLIPSTLYTPPDLNEISNGWLEAIPTKMKYVIKLNRAGVHERSYQNTMYKLIPGGIKSRQDPFHVVTEGASPLLTFFEVQKHSHRYSSTYNEFNKEILKSFYRTLQNLLNDNPDCRDFCELVYYDEYDANGRKVNPAKILLQRIKNNK